MEIVHQLYLITFKFRTRKKHEIFTLFTQCAHRNKSRIRTCPDFFFYFLRLPFALMREMQNIKILVLVSRKTNIISQIKGDFFTIEVVKVNYRVKYL